MPNLRPVFLAAAAAIFISACAPRARVTPPSTVFVTRLGSDTLSMEEFTHTPTAIVGRAVTRSPNTVRRDFTYRYNPDGTIATLEMIARRADSVAAPPVGRGVYTFTNDSVYIETGLPPNVQVQRIPSSLVHMAWIGFVSFANFERVASHAPAAVGDSVVLVIYNSPLLGGPNPLVVKRVAPDTVTLRARHLGTMRVNVDERGRALGFNGLGSSLNYIVTRETRVPLDSIGRAFAARDAAGVLGSVSPRDTVRAVVHGARFMVDYGRPSKRGREIFGLAPTAVVPWNRVWRTGANLATHFTTERDVVIGGLMVPAGTYTLWTLPAASGWLLIVNKQTGQWGTVYDRAQDLGRVPMAVRRLDEPVERFTIRIEPRAVGGVLALAWDTFEATVPFSSR